MKCSKKNILKTGLVIFSFSMLYSCGGGNGNTGANVTEIDSAEDTAAVRQDYQQNYTDAVDVSPDNSVRIDFDENSNFDWEEFKNGFQARTEAIGEGFQVDDNEVTTSWENLNDDYSYQTAYRNRPDGLWMQTYYRKNNGQNQTEAERNEDRRLLTRDESKDLNLEELWEDMEESAQSFADSIF
jgi:hypothetical protein